MHYPGTLFQQLVSETAEDTTSFSESCFSVFGSWHPGLDQCGLGNCGILPQTIWTSLISPVLCLCSYLCSTLMYTLVLGQWHVIILISVEYLFLSVCQQPVCCISAACLLYSSFNKTLKLRDYYLDDNRYYSNSVQKLDWWSLRTNSMHVGWEDILGCAQQQYTP